MTATVTFSCDYCPATQIEVAGVSPLGWWDVPGKGKDGGTGHACAECMMAKPAVYADVIERRDGETRRILGENPVREAEDIPIH